jgi:proton-translocating NAD(P)+ transhydrogenase subunit alpha
VLAGADRGLLATVLGFVAVTSATINAVGGFIITDRMLKMFRRGGRPRGDAK